MDDPEDRIADALFSIADKIENQNPSVDFYHDFISVLGRIADALEFQNRTGGNDS